MNLNQLQYFKVLAQEEHYTRAAQILSITQPSLITYYSTEFNACHSFIGR